MKKFAIPYDPSQEEVKLGKFSIRSTNINVLFESV